MFSRTKNLLRRLRPCALRTPVRAALVSLLILGTIWSPVAFAVQIQLKNGLQIHQLTEERTEGIGVLKAGSILDVPDQYRVNDDAGKFSPELTLNNWLKTAGKTGMSEEHKAGGVLMKASDHLDYYYPVKIVTAAPGSSLKTYNGKTFFLALRMIKRQKDQQLATREDTKPVESARSTTAATAAPAIPKPIPRPQLEAAALCLDGTCHERTQVAAFDRLIHDLTPALREASLRSFKTKQRTADDMRHLSEEFQRSCGISLASFIPVIKKHSETAGIPADIMLSIMVQESSGHCFATGHNENSSDRGLFGVNSRTSRLRRCQSNEIDWLRHARVSNLASGPHCVENPVVNLDLAISILTAKAELLTSDMNHRGSHYSAYDEARLVDKNGNYTRDAWRLAVSAYNGGERWVMKAKSDLEQFNRQNGTRLDAHNWEDLRIFYLRNYLDSTRETHYFSQSHEGRNEDKAISNLAYAENIVPRKRAGANDTPTVNEYWRRYLAKQE